VVIHVHAPALVVDLRVAEGSRVLVDLERAVSRAEDLESKPDEHALAGVGAAAEVRVRGAEVAVRVRQSVDAERKDRTCRRRGVQQQAGVRRGHVHHGRVVCEVDAEAAHAGVRYLVEDDVDVERGVIRDVCTAGVGEGAALVNRVDARGVRRVGAVDAGGGVAGGVGIDGEDVDGRWVRLVVCARELTGGDDRQHGQGSNEPQNERAQD
jgi:hypothetical protein